MEFIDQGEFLREVALQKEEDKVLRWVELPICKIYRVERYESFTYSKFNTPCYTVHLIDKTDCQIKVWGSEKLIKKLQQKLPKQAPYIASVGKKTISGNREVNAFNLHMKLIAEEYLIQ